MIREIAAFIKEYSLIEEGDLVVCGVSGGADSICLLYCLKALEKEGGFRLHAVHVHHGIRGREADEDERFVRDTAERLKIPYKAVFADVPAYAETHKKSEEEAGRILRKEAFSSYIREIGAERAKIALAHHRDDLAETVIFQLARGSGLAGLAGIRPKLTDGEITVIRPLLGIPRQRIEDWLRKEGIPYRTDHTNLEDKYIRNRIRHHVMPYLEAEIHRGASCHLAENAFLAGEALDFIEEEARKRSAQYVRVCGSDSKAEEILLAKEAFSEEPPFMIPYILRYCLKMISPHQQDISRIHLEDLKKLAGRQTGKQIDLPGGLVAERTYEGLRFCKKNVGKKQEEGFDEELAEGKTVRIPGWKLYCTEDNGICFPIPEKTYTKWIDFAIISDELRVRTRKPGDFLTVRSDGARKKLSDYMTDARIPVSRRDRIPVIADGQEIVWIIGYRLNERYKISEKTEKILRIDALCDSGPAMEFMEANNREHAGEKNHE